MIKNRINSLAFQIKLDGWLLRLWEVFDKITIPAVTNMDIDIT